MYLTVDLTSFLILDTVQPECMTTNHYYYIFLMIIHKVLK